jgi:hypothetical protein
MRAQGRAKLRRRVDVLEDRSLCEPTILTMPDGREARIFGDGDYFLRLFCCGLEGANPKQAAHLELIRESTDIKEPGGGRMVELIRCMLHGPARKNLDNSERPSAGTHG